VVLTGAGDRHFCAGAETKLLEDRAAQAQGETPKRPERRRYQPSSSSRSRSSPP